MFLRLDRLKSLAVEPVLKSDGTATPNPAPTPVGDPQTAEGLGLSGSGSDIKRPGLEQEEQPPMQPLTSTSSGDVSTATGPTDSDPSPPTLAPAPAADETPLTAPEQLFFLVKFIEEHFRDIVEELDRLKADGYMSYRLLWAICAPGSIVEAKDDATEHPIGLKVESWGYGVE